MLSASSPSKNKAAMSHYREGPGRHNFEMKSEIAKISCHLGLSLGATGKAAGTTFLHRSVDEWTYLMCRRSKLGFLPFAQALARPGAMDSL